jgi:hypothetical protein
MYQIFGAEEHPYNKGQWTEAMNLVKKMKKIENAPKAIKKN